MRHTGAQANVLLHYTEHKCTYSFIFEKWQICHPLVKRPFPLIHPLGAAGAGRLFFLFTTLVLTTWVIYLSRRGFFCQLHSMAQNITLKYQQHKCDLSVLHCSADKIWKLWLFLPVLSCCHFLVLVLSEVYDILYVVHQGKSHLHEQSDDVSPHNGQQKDAMLCFCIPIIS